MYSGGSGVVDFPVHFILMCWSFPRFVAFYCSALMCDSFHLFASFSGFLCSRWWPIAVKLLPVWFLLLSGDSGRIAFIAFSCRLEYAREYSVGHTITYHTTFRGLDGFALSAWNVFLSSSNHPWFFFVVLSLVYVSEKLLFRFTFTP